MIRCFSLPESVLRGPNDFQFVYQILLLLLLPSAVAHRQRLRICALHFFISSISKHSEEDQLTAWPNQHNYIKSLRRTRPSPTPGFLYSLIIRLNTLLHEWTETSWFSSRLPSMTTVATFKLEEGIPYPFQAQIIFSSILKADYPCFTSKHPALHRSGPSLKEI